MMIRSFLIALFTFTCLTGHAADWPRFRGPAGSGVAVDSDSLPTAWSPEANVAWKTPLPGPGASSPIIAGGSVFVTCYSGYGLNQEDPGEIENLVRHLVCIDLKTGEQLWQKDVKAALPEDPYSGIGVTAHGYASHTPVSDGKNVYAFFGKSGVYAYDLEGNQLWNAEVGKESDPTKWGSSSSPIVHEKTVIVTASAESQAIVGLDKATGAELWRQETKGLDGMWGTPTLVEIDDNRTDIVMCVAKELWGLDPNSGKLRWYADATDAQHAYASVIFDGSRVFAFTGRGGGNIAIDAGGSGDVSASNTVWEGSISASFASPVRHEGRIYVVTRGVLSVVDAETGERVQQLRLKGARQTGGRMGSLDYPSPVVVGNRLFNLNGSGQMFVIALDDKVKQMRVNEVTTDKEDFRGTPAVSNGRMVLRSSKYLYCVADQGDTVVADDNLVASADDDSEADESGPGGGRAGGRPDGGRRRFDPMSMFKGLDTDSDGQITEAELEGHRMADRLKTLDKDDDQAISQEEFQTGIASLFRRGGGRGRRGEDSRPDRPQRPEAAG
ncbi:MAG: PQQ-binding-like beta-propeller repeat protein [Bythopirellula sp.]